jgi:uncharacterized protein
MAVVAQLAQIIAAGLGGLLFHWLHVPAAWLSGAVVGAVLWSALGFGRPLPKALVDLAMLLSGASMGAAVTPEAIAAMGRYPLSLGLLVVGVAAITLASSLWLMRLSGWRRDDALLASVPGALSTVLAIAADRQAAVGPIAIVQSLRLFILIALLPMIVARAGGEVPRLLLGEGQPLATPVGLACILIVGLMLGALFERIRLAAPILLGAAVASATLHGTSLAPGVVPPVVATGGLVLLGIFIAERFRGLDRQALRTTAPAALGSFLIGLAVAALFAATAALLARVSFADALIAFAPGGLEAMMVLALLLGLDPLYVGVHHLVRFLGIGFVLPVLFGWLQRDRPPEA